MTFSELGLHEDLITAIDYMGFKTATPIQEQAIPLILNGKDLIGCAQTGTGKTAAFLLPVLDSIIKNRKDGIKALIMVPTRELAIQIDQQIEAIGYTADVSSLSIYGGGDGSGWKFQKESLQGGTDIVVATPGKLISHLNLGYVDFSTITHLILDEADRMLDIGFHDDIMKIAKHLPERRQSLLFSATMPRKIKDLAKKLLRSPEEISIAVSKPAEGILQVGYMTYDHQKVDLIENLIVGKKDVESIIVFCSTKKSVVDVVRALQKNKINAEAISSDLDQGEREDVLRKFRAKKVRVLVATDVISRGIDIKGIDLVINFNVPKDAEDYVHRIGRTARAETTGVAITFINEDEMFYFAKAENLIEKEILKLHPPMPIGKGPEWNASAKKSSGRPSFKGRSSGRNRSNYKGRKR